jgi:hypothetical protein
MSLGRNRVILAVTRLKSLIVLPNQIDLNDFVATNNFEHNT